MEDIIKSIKATLYERTGNPFLLSFSLAWCLHNYRVIMIVLSNDSLNIKLEKVDSYFGSNVLFYDYVINYGCLLHAVIFPLIYSLLYIFVFPFFSIRINEYHFKKQKELLAAKQKAEELELLTKEKSQELRRSFILLENELKVQMEKLLEENSELKKLIKIGNNSVKTEIVEEIVDKPFVLSDDEVKILKAFLGFERRSVLDVADKLSLDIDRVKLICQELVYKQLLSQEILTKNGFKQYSLEHLGRRYLADRKLI